MSETIQNGLWQILKGSPIAVALLVMYWLGNNFWGSRLSEMIDHQARINDRMASAIEKISNTQVDLVKSIEQLHALLLDHLRDARK